MMLHRQFIMALSYHSPPLSHHMSHCPTTMLRVPSQCFALSSRLLQVALQWFPGQLQWFIVPLQCSTLLSPCFIIPLQYFLPPQYLLSHYSASSFITTFYCPIKALSHHSGPFPHHGPGSYYLQKLTQVSYSFPHLIMTFLYVITTLYDVITTTQCPITIS